MIKSTIRDYKDETIQLVKKLELLPLGTAWENVYCFSEIYEALDKANPSLMFYGIYNSGKSSLLNSIFGEEKASVNDVPETHRVTEYPWNSYTLVDTPGLNGPKEDEKVTLEEIDKHDVIMFVIDDSDNFDSEEITKRIVDILNARKPCIIVINKKNDSDEEKITNIKAKMQKNIEKLYCKSDNYDFIAVNAVSAMKARKEDKKALLEDSKIEMLEYLIEKKLKFAEGIQMLLSPIELSLKLCETMKNQFATVEDNEVVTNLNRVLERFYYAKEAIKQEFLIELKKQLYVYGEEIYQQAANSKAENVGEDVDKERYEQEIQNLVQTYMGKYAKESQTTFENVKHDWKLELNLSSVSVMGEMDIKISKSERNKDTLDELLDEIEKIPILIPLPVPTPIPIPLPVLVKAVKVAKEWLLGSGPEEIPDVDELNHRQEEYRRKRELALRELRIQVDMAMEQLKQSVQESFVEQLEIMYGASCGSINKILVEQEGYNLLVAKKIDEIAAVETKLQELKQVIIG